MKLLTFIKEVKKDKKEGGYMKTWFLRTAVFLGILTSAFLLTCHKKEQGKNIIGERTKLPETDTSLKQVIIVADTLKFIYTPGASKPTYKPGDILVGQTGEGYLKKVVSTTTSDDTLIVFTEQACLTEAIKRCEIETTFILMPEERQFEKIRQDITFTDEKGRRYWMGIYVKKMLVEPHPELAEFTIPLYDVRMEIKDASGNLVAFFACDTIILTKRIKPDIGITIDWFNLKEFHLIVHDTNKLEFKHCQVGWELSLSKEIEKDLISIPLGRYVIWVPTVPSVPIVFTFALDISAGLEANATLSVSFEISNNVNLVSGSAIGARYEEGSWSPVNEWGLSGNANFTGNPSVSISVDAEGSLKGKLGCKIYGVAGPYLFLKPYQYNELSYPPFDFRLGIGLGAGLEFNVKILSWVLAEFSYKFLDLKKELIHSTIPPNNPPNTPTTPSGPSSGQPGVSYNFSSSATDPDGDSVSIRFDWGDGNISNWSSFVPSGTSVTMSKSWSNPGTYYVKAQAKDKNGATSNWSTGHQIVIASGGQGTLKWSFTTGGYVYSSPAIGSDGTIYVGSYDDTLYAIKPDGTLKWSFPTGGDVYSSPAIGSDGTIYVGSWDGKLYAINPDGTLKWSFTTGEDVFSSPAIGSDGTIYVGSYDNKLYAINPDGTLKWSFTTGDAVRSSPAIGSDGTIYVGSYDGKLYAINPDGTLKWSFTIRGWVVSSPAIGSDGTIYVGSDKLYAINPDGTLKWSFTTLYRVWSSPAIGNDGTIYVGSYDGKLYAINPDGTLKWSFTTGREVWSSPAIGSDGTIYVGSEDNKLYAINPDGTLKWSFTTGWDVHSSPAIGSDGTIYVGSGYKLYAIYGSGTLANTPWPKFRHDLKNTGRVGGP